MWRMKLPTCGIYPPRNNPIASSVFKSDVSHKKNIFTGITPIKIYYNRLITFSGNWVKFNKPDSLKPSRDSLLSICVTEQ